MLSAQIRSIAQQHTAGMIDFCRRLIQTPSLPGDEGKVAALVKAEMQHLGFDQVWIDPWGNVIGLLDGREPDPSLMFNGHMDHVDPGPASNWAYPPYGAEIHSDAIWGRGAADMKGALAAMIYAAGALIGADLRPAGQLYVAAVVQEEVGGLGTRNLLQQVRPDLAVVGEASRNQLARGHRGRVEIVIRIQGRSVHASMPHEEVNPLAVLAHFIQGLEGLKPSQSPSFGVSTVAPTLLRSDQTSSNVTPGELALHLDWRNVPDENSEDVMRQLRPVLEQALARVPGSTGSLRVHARRLSTWTGQEQQFEAIFPAFGRPADDPLVQNGQKILADFLGRPVDAIIWPFATDGGHLATAGIPTIGFGPGDERVLHTVREHLPLAMLHESLIGYMALALNLGATALPGSEPPNYEPDTADLFDRLEPAGGDHRAAGSGCTILFDRLASLALAGQPATRYRLASRFVHERVGRGGARAHVCD